MKLLLLVGIAVMCCPGLGRADDYDARQQQKKADEMAYEKRLQQEREDMRASERRQQRNKMTSGPIKTPPTAKRRREVVKNTNLRTPTLYSNDLS